MVIFLLSFVKGSKSAEGGKNPLADMDPGGPNGPGGPILGGSKSARTPAKADLESSFNVLERVSTF